MKVFPEKFKFFFKRNSEKYECKYSPDEWNNNVLNWERSSNSEGLIVKYTTNFSFIKEDADYLRLCFKATGVFSEVKFIVERYDYSTFSFEPYYSADIDFYSYEDTKNKVSVVTTEISYRASMEANLDTTYEIDLPNAANFVRYDRIRLKSTIACTGDTNETGISSLTSITPSLFITTEDIFGGKVQVQSVLGPNLNNLEENASDLWILQANDSVSLNISVSFDFTIQLLIRANDGYIQLLMFVGKEINDARKVEIGSVRVTKDQQYAYLKGNVNLANQNINTGENVYFVIRPTSLMRVESVKSNTDMKVDINYYDRIGNTKDIYGLRPIDLLKSLIEKATAGEYNQVKSNLLTIGEVSNMLITSGDLIRGIEGAKIKTSLKDFFQAFKSMFGASYTFKNINGVETLEVEQVNYFYDRNTMITEVDDISDHSMKVKDNDVYNKLKIGYEDQTYDEVNGKKEFNTTVEFSINSKHNGKELNLISPYRADMYGIEFTIVDYEQQETTDSNNDNDVFIIHTGSRLSGFINGYSLNRNYKILNSDSYVGATAFNVYLSPKRCLLRQIEYIKSLFMFSGDELKFASSTKDYDVTSTGWIVEHSDVLLSNYSNLFKPITHEFETMVPANISDLINEGYRGYIAFIDNGELLKGFIESISENPGRNKSQKWKLIEL